MIHYLIRYACTITNNNTIFNSIKIAINLRVGVNVLYFEINTIKRGFLKYKKKKFILKV